MIYGIVVAFTFSLYYHLLNGVRHLMWDIGKGFEKNIAKKNAILIMLLAIVLAILTILFIDYFLSFYLKY
jgi:succinate dehydrogenase / fumarate reductase cytochrome b subunit